MEFIIKNIKKSINDMMRQIGYKPAYFQEAGEFSIVRPVMRGDYPRFHAYITQQGMDFTFKLHLDQKKASYEGVTGHSGEYDGTLVENEAQRIKNSLSL